MDTTISLDILIYRYSTKPSIENKLNAKTFRHFYWKVEIKMIKNQWSCKLINNATKNGIDPAKTAPKGVVKTSWEPHENKLEIK